MFTRELTCLTHVQLLTWRLLLTWSLEVTSNPEVSSNLEVSQTTANLAHVEHKGYTPGGIPTRNSYKELLLMLSRNSYAEAGKISDVQTPKIVTTRNS
jgi:hypothetical protein